MSRSILYKKYLIYFVNLMLFIGFIIYATKYSSLLIQNFNKINKYYFSLALFIQFIILIITSYKWKILLKKFNKKISFNKLFQIYNASNVYKYIPPKGLHLIMRVNFLKKEDIQGKITTIITEFYTELMISMIAALIFIIFFMPFNKNIIILTLIIVVILTLITIKPDLGILILDKLRIKFDKLRRFIIHFSRLRRSKYFFQSFLISICVAVLHGFSFYLINKSFNFEYISFWQGLIIYYSAHFLSLISFTPAGLGVRDISITGLLFLYNYPKPDALIISLMSRIVLFIAEFTLGISSLYFIKFKK